MMKKKDIYFMNKLAYPESLLIVKNGVFYNSFDKDAVILEDLLDLKINLEMKVGFPTSSLKKVIEQLKLLKISYVIFESETEFNKKIYVNDNYSECIKKTKERYKRIKKGEYICNKIESYLNSNNENIDSIYNFITK